MAIDINKMADVNSLKNNKAKKDKGNTIVESDYVLRDKKAEAKDLDKLSMNTRDITEDVDRYAKELAEMKAKYRAEAQAEVKQELLAGDFLKDLKAQIKAEMLAESGATTEDVKKPAPKAK